MKFTYTSGEQPLQGYTIQRGLGKGGFGEVYQAVSDGGKEVALKLVQRHLNVELRGVNHCLNLKHPNLVALYDVREAANGDHWVVMEYVAGGTLDQVLANHPHGLPPQEVIGWLRGICAAVAYLHERGIVHRDLKPGNIFLENGIVKIGDYGLSKFISASRRSGQTESVGTVHYMAPEVSKGRYNRELDLYALGVVVYEMLTGRVPFEGESPGEILMKHLTAEPDMTGVPASFRPAVARLLDKDPQRRYASVADALADLEAALPACTDARPVSVGYVAGPPRPEPRTEAYHPARPITAQVASGPHETSQFAPLNAAKPLWRALRGGVARQVPLVLRLGVAVFIGAGIGMLSAGIALLVFRPDPVPWWMYSPHQGHVPVLLGVGVGALTAGGMAYALLRSFTAFRWWRILVALGFGLGIGMMTGGVTDWLRGQPSDAAGFLGVGSGFLAGGGMVCLLFFGPARARPAADSCAWRTSSGRWRSSVQARPLLWSACLFLSVLLAAGAGLVLRIVDRGRVPDADEMRTWASLGFGLSALVGLTFCAWVYVWRSLPPPPEPEQPAQVRSYERQPS
jgi:hypothetical protein